VAAFTAFPAAAQTGPVHLRVGAHAIGMMSRIDPGIGDRIETEPYLTQSMLLGHVSLAGGTFELAATLDLEGLTLPDGELAPGNAGEGYVDKRHPHTYMHELMATVSPRLSAVDLTISAGRGFAPFGTDDPMVRPFVRYPANHHWSQILERWVLMAALRRGPLSIEAGLFNGNEPQGPDDVGGFDRFGDSWSARGTLRPAAGLELQGSYAYIESPEFRSGFGLDQRKWSASARLERALSPASTAYLFLEMAETHEYADGREAFIFTSVLGEAAWRPGPWTSALRFERTTRPEEERLLDPYRSPRPHSDETIIGATRWNTVTAQVARSFSMGGSSVAPFIEFSHNAIEEVTGAIFDPVAFYGSTSIWSVSLGIRIRAGMQHRRMGRYGAALPAAPHDDDDMHMTNRDQ